MKYIKIIKKRILRLKSSKAAQIVCISILCGSMIGLSAWFHFSPKGKMALNSTSASTQDDVTLPVFSAPVGAMSLQSLQTMQVVDGIPRLALMHTTFQLRSVTEITEYTVQKGDNLFSIAEKFGLEPSTILWGNLYNLGDNPEMIYPDQKLNILPVNGVYYQWHQGDGLNKVSEVLGVKPEDIIDFPGNHLDKATIGDYSNPNIPVGTWLIVPDGTRNFITWSAPTISRFNPGVAHLYGDGACDQPMDGAVGTGSFTNPTVETWLSGYDYTPGANHPAVDYAGSIGNAIYAADNGVIVYAGWNDHGYGNVIVIDHGNGYQTLYAHLSQIRVGCGQSVYQGGLIGNMGSTGRSSGPHLHFEMWYNGTHINPHDYLAITGTP
jgi:LysM repeat protein